MKKAIVTCFFLFVTISSGCSQDLNITEAEAKQIVLDEHCEGIGQVEIKTVLSEEDKYIIEWEIEPIKQGKDSVHMKTGEIKAIESSHGTCRWF